MPPTIREMIYLVEQQDAGWKKRKRKASSGDLPRVHITNVQPSPYHPASAAYDTAPGDEPEMAGMAASAWRPARVSIPGPRDEAVRQYCE